MSKQELILFNHWYDFVKWLFDRTEKFPKSVRHTLTNRMENLALDVQSGIMEARYTTKKESILRRADLKKDELQILLRLSHDRGYLSRKSYEHASELVHEAGRMLGGWRKQQQRKGA